MVINVNDLKQIRKNIDLSNKYGISEMKKFVRRRQPVLYNEIRFVLGDIRCKDSGHYCLLFCGMALKLAEERHFFYSKKMDDYRMQILKSLIAQDKYNANKDFVKIITSIEKYVINLPIFNEDDVSWLKINIGAFLIMLDLQSRNKVEILELYQDMV